MSAYLIFKYKLLDRDKIDTLTGRAVAIDDK
jgi:hypothetical protein